MAILTAWPKPPLVRVHVGVAAHAVLLGSFERHAGMALLARRDRMYAQEREARDLVVEEHLPLPRIRSVAAAACGSLLALVDIVGAVAGVAILPELLLARWLQVAGLTVGSLVRSLKLEVRVAPVIEGCWRPRNRAVTVITTGPETAAVCIVRLVTGDARAREGLAARIARVAAPTLEAPMLPVQLEFRIAVVVEAGLPAGRRVAIPALAAEAAPMDVFRAMAGHAVGGCVLVALGRVARRASGLAVLAFQHEARRRVVEAPVLPAVGRVAVAAGLTEGAAVGVVVAVTVIACARRLSVRRVRNVAGLARHALVSPHQRMVRHVVIECVAIEPEHVAVAPAVLVVAGIAGLVGPDGGPPVVARVALEIELDFVMAFETQSALGAAVEGLVALATVGLDVGMGSSHIARHHQPLDDAGVGRGRQQEQRSEDELGNGAQALAQYRWTAITWTTAAANRSPQRGRCSACQREKMRS